jgi:hypothetical protein
MFIYAFLYTIHPEKQIDQIRYVLEIKTGRLLKEKEAFAGNVQQFFDRLPPCNYAILGLLSI